MKNYFLTFSLLTLYLALGQSQTYHLSVTSEPYVDLVGGTDLVSADWDDPAFTVPIGFSFELFDENLTTLYQLSDLAYPILLDGSPDFVMSLLIPFGADLIDRGYGTGQLQSPITYKTEGPVGQRVLTVEWKNAGFYGEVFINGESNDYVNVQLKLYESNGDIVYHYGPSSIANPGLDYDSTGAFVGVVEDLDLVNKMMSGEVVLLTGNPSEPSTVETYTEAYLDGNILPNTRYTFSREVTAVDDPFTSLKKQYYFPNPATDKIWLDPTLSGFKSPVEIYDASGLLVMKDEDPGTVDVSRLQNGIYFIKMKNEAGLQVQRIVVAR